MIFLSDKNHHVQLDLYFHPKKRMWDFLKYHSILGIVTFTKINKTNKNQSFKHIGKFWLLDSLIDSVAF